MDELLAELETTNAELAGKLRAALAADTDTSKGTLAGAEKRAKAAEKLAEKLKSDLDVAARGNDAATAAALKERDEAKAIAERATSEYTAYRTRVALEKRLGIADEKWSRRAADAFLADYAGDGLQLDEHGAIVGADRALEAFKASEPQWFVGVEPAPERPSPGRPGSGPSPAKPAGAARAVAKTEREKIDEYKARRIAAMPKRKGAVA